MDLATVDDGWLSYVDRALAKSLVLVTEKGLSQSQLRAALEQHSLCTLRGDDNGSVVIYFDCNVYGKKIITAPQIRVPPLQESTVTKLWKAVRKELAREPGGARHSASWRLSGHPRCWEEAVHLPAESLRHWAQSVSSWTRGETSKMEKSRLEKSSCILPSRPQS